MPQTAKLDRYINKGVDQIRERLWILLTKVNTGSRKEIEEIKKLIRSAEGCDSWEAVCARWLQKNNGCMANNLRGVDSTMARMIREIEDPNPFAEGVAGEPTEEDLQALLDMPSEPVEEDKPILPPNPVAGKATSAVLLAALQQFLTEAISEADGYIKAGAAGETPPAVRLLMAPLSEALRLAMMLVPVKERLLEVQRLNIAALGLEGAPRVLSLVLTLPGEVTPKEVFFAYYGDANALLPLGVKVEDIRFGSLKGGTETFMDTTEEDLEALTPDAQARTPDPAPEVASEPDPKEAKPPADPPKTPAPKKDPKAEEVKPEEGKGKATKKGDGGAP